MYLIFLMMISLLGCKISGGDDKAGFTIIMILQVLFRRCSGVLLTVPEPANTVTCIRRGSLHCLSAYTCTPLFCPHFHDESTMLFSWVLPIFLILLPFNNHTNINGT